MRLLINLPPGFFTHPSLTPIFERLESLASETRRTSFNAQAEILPDWQWAEAVLMWSWPRWTPDALDTCPDLKFCAHLDIGQGEGRLLLERGIPVSTARRAFSPAVAEMALTLILSTLRRTPSHQAALWQGTETWVKKFPDDIDTDERQLTGRRVGLIGFGAIGQRIAELLGPFHIDLAVHDPYLPAGVAEKFNAQNIPIADLAARSEVLVLCAAANAGSKHILTAEHIESLPKGGVLVNVARASLLDSDALLARLKHGDLYAALDVFDKEPLEADSPLRSLPNVYLTPHRAGGIMESVERILTYLADDLEAFQKGEPRRHALTEAMIPMLDA